MQNISEEAAQLSLALEVTKSGIWEWNIEAGTVAYSTSWRRLMKYSDGQAISWPLLIHHDDLNSVITALIRHCEGENTSYESEHRLINGTGEWHWVQETGRIIERDADGLATRIIGTTQIIDSRVALEQQKNVMQERLVHAAKMESIGLLTAGIAHDFNNLLGAVLGYAELSMEQLNAPPTDEIDNIKDYLSQIISAGTRAKELIKQMLVFSRQKPAISEDTPVSPLKPILTEVFHLVRSSIPSSIELNVQVVDSAIKARIEPIHFHQILLNLIINARDAIGQFGQIDVKLSQNKLYGVCSSCQENFEGEFVEISVRDTGSGISSKQLQNIFDPFFTTKQTGEGTGMGLSVVHGLVHSLKGHIFVESCEGKGTTVRILFPSVKEVTVTSNTSKATHFSPDSCQLAGLRIMVVDDEIALSSMLAELFDFHGAEVFTYNKPEKALAELIRNPDLIDILITDATMPGISGLELSRAILQLRPKLPILICTGYSNYVNEDIARQSGIAAFMPKPLDIPELLKWIDSQRPIQQEQANGTDKFT